MRDADVLDTEGTFKGLEVCEECAGWGEVAVLGKGEEVWFEDVVVSVPCFWRDGSGRVGVHWGVILALPWGL